MKAIVQNNDNSPAVLAFKGIDKPVDKPLDKPIAEDDLLKDNNMQARVMKAIVQNAYGSPDVLALKEVDKPVVTDNDVLVRVHVAGLNAGDYFTMRGRPWLIRMSLGLRGPKTTFWDGTWPEPLRQSARR